MCITLFFLMCVCDDFNKFKKIISKDDIYIPLLLLIDGWRI